VIHERLVPGSVSDEPTDGRMDIRGQGNHRVRKGRRL